MTDSAWSSSLLIYRKHSHVTGCREEMLSPAFWTKSQGKCPYFWSCPNFLITQCKIGRRKPPCQKELDLSNRFDTIGLELRLTDTYRLDIEACQGLRLFPQCDTDRQTDRQTDTGHSIYGAGISSRGKTWDMRSNISNRQRLVHSLALPVADSQYFSGNADTG